MGRPREFDIGTARSAVRDAFWQHGFASTSVDDLLAATRLGKGSFYAAFGDKRAAFLGVLREYSSARVEEMRAQCSASPRAIEALRAVVQPDMRSRGCFLLNCAFEAHTSRYGGERAPPRGLCGAPSGPGGWRSAGRGRWGPSGVHAAPRVSLRRF